MEIILTEITSNTGNINKKIFTDGREPLPNAQIYDGSARTLRVDVAELPSYLESLNTRSDTAIIFGVWGPGGDQPYRIVTKAAGEDVDARVIARSSERFAYANNDSVSLMLLDVDGGYTRDQINDFLHSLELLLHGSLIGATELDRTRIMRFEKPSTSGGIIQNGKKQEKWHIYIPVKNANKDLVKQIFQWAWYYKFRNHRINKAAVVDPQSIIDGAVGEANRLCFEADAEVIGELHNIEIVARKCNWYPGGVVDCELALEILRTVTGEYRSAWLQEKRRVEDTPEYKDAVRERISFEIQKGIEAKLTPAQARARAVARISDKVLLSSETIETTNGEKVSVYDILVDRESWIGKRGFLDPLDPVPHTNKGMVAGNDHNVALHSKDHGGVKYFMRFDLKGIQDWMNSADSDELITKFSSYMAQSSVITEYRDILYAEYKKVTKVNVSTARDSVKNKTVATNEDRKREETDSSEICYVGEKASQGEIVSSYLRSFGPDMVKSYAGRLYVFDHTIWKKRLEGEITDDIETMYPHCLKNQFVTQYGQMAKYVLSKPAIYTEVWDTKYGIPCASGFWKVGDNGLEMIKYSKDLGCRYKLGFNPDWNMPIPLWKKVVANVVNPKTFQQGLGLALCGYLTKAMQKALILYGPGGSGKGTTDRVLIAMLPKGRVAHLSMEQMSDAKSVIEMVDAAINVMPEIQKGKMLNTTGFKMATGGDEMTAWRLFMGPVQFQPEASQLLNINDWPVLDSGGIEMRRRLGDFICEFRESMEDGGVVLMDQAIIADELPGVLAWMMDGVNDYFQNGLQSDHSHFLMNQWVSSFDSFTLFARDCIQVSSNREVLKSAMYRAYKGFCEASGYKFPLRMGHFNDACRKVFDSPVEIGGRDYYKCVNFTEEGMRFAEAEDIKFSRRRSK